MKSIFRTSIFVGCIALAGSANADDGWFCSKDGHRLDVAGTSVTEAHMNCEKEGGVWTRAMQKTESAPAPSTSMGGGGGW